MILICVYQRPKWFSNLGWTNVTRTSQPQYRLGSHSTVFLISKRKMCPKIDINWQDVQNSKSEHSLGWAWTDWKKSDRMTVPVWKHFWVGMWLFARVMLDGETRWHWSATINHAVSGTERYPLSTKDVLYKLLKWVCTSIDDWGKCCRVKPTKAHVPQSKIKVTVTGGVRFQNPQVTHVPTIQWKRNYEHTCSHSSGLLWYGLLLFDTVKQAE